MLQNRVFFALASRSGFGAAISDAVARSSVFCNSVSADRIVMAASRLLLATGACVILLSFAAGLRKSYWTYEKGRNEKRWAGIRWEELRWDELWIAKSVVWNVGREECSVKCEECSVKFFRHPTSSWVRWYVSCLFDLCWLRWSVGDLQFGWGSAFRISWTLVGTCNCFFTSTMGNFDPPYDVVW